MTRRGPPAGCSSSAAPTSQWGLDIFLIAAVDHIEAAFSRFLTEHPISRVNAELLALRQTALDQLGELSGRYEIDPAQVLRRLIARRCIYGVDLNAVAVELARLGVWIHTFVPGLPLGFLDRNLICGNSLSGFTGLDEAYAFLGEGTLFKSLIQDGLNESQAALERLANLNDATIADIEEARKASQIATDALEPVRRFLDLLALQRASLIGVDCSILGGIEDASPHWQNPNIKSWWLNSRSSTSQLHFPKCSGDHNLASPACSEIHHGRRSPSNSWASTARKCRGSRAEQVPSSER